MVEVYVFFAIDLYQVTATPSEILCRSGHRNKMRQVVKTLSVKSLLFMKLLHRIWEAERAIVQKVTKQK